MGTATALGTGPGTGSPSPPTAGPATSAPGQATTGPVIIPQPSNAASQPSPAASVVASVVTPPASVVTVSPAASVVPASNQFVLQVVTPSSTNVTLKYHRKRQSPVVAAAASVFLSATGSTSDCGTANTYTIADGQLIFGASNLPAAVDPGLPYISLNGATSGTITRQFSVVNNDLVWTNPAFFNGQATFCTLNGGVYAVFTSAGGPAGCVTVQLAVIASSSNPYPNRTPWVDADPAVLPQSTPAQLWRPAALCQILPRPGPLLKSVASRL